MTTRPGPAERAIGAADIGRRLNEEADNEASFIEAEIRLASALARRLSKGDQDMPDRNPVYDGREMIGEIRRLGPHEVEAFDVKGKRLGKFPDPAGAMHAVREAVTRACRG